MLLIFEKLSVFPLKINTTTEDYQGWMDAKRTERKVNHFKYIFQLYSYKLHCT
jgi:hypothetical protein